MTTNEDKLRYFLKRVTADLQETRRRLRDHEDAAGEPIAIVGMSCRYPGGVNSPEELWELVSEGRDAVTPFPEDRGWDLDALYDPDPEHRGTSYSREGAFLSDLARFDAGLFGISPREALAMDPQQRLLLEASWELFERAGIDVTTLAGSRTGVFAGVMNHEFLAALQNAPEDLEGYLGTGSSGSVASGRIAYTFGLEGPAVTVDTACSSSLVALHLAVQALRNGECELAVAGGVTAMVGPATFIGFSRQRGLAPDGRCKAFAAGADGTGWGEGVGLLLVERLSDARRNGHEVLAVVRGSAVNQDGASNGLTAPNGPSQQRVIRQALAAAKLTAGQVDAVEAHGTGTRLGDPIEAQALLATYGRERSEDRPLWLGSIKSNIGHTQAAAGVAGVIKMVMAMRNDALPRTLHVDEPTPHVDWSAGGVRLLTESVPWPGNGEPRRAAVSSFGISGTNAHTIIEEAPAAEESPEEHPAEDGSAGESPAADLPAGNGKGDAPATAGASDAGPAAENPGGTGTGRTSGTTGDTAPPTPTGPLPWVLSGRTESALRAQAARLLPHVESLTGAGGEEAPAPLTDLAYSLAATRAALEHRAVVVGETAAQLADGLRAVAAGETAPGVLSGHTAGKGRVGFLFSGQGSQRSGMGRELYAAYPAFAAAYDEVCAHLDIAVDADDLSQTGVTQPALFAIEVALFRLLESWGIRPDYVAGHSVGEIAAAHVAGVLSLADAAKLVSARASLMQALPSGGAMIAIQATEDEVLPHLTDGIGIAALNGPRSVVVSGDEAGVTAVAEHFSAQGRKTSRLKVSHAFHSPLMDPMLDEFAAVARGLTYAEPTIPVVSNVTGALAEPYTADYWVRHVRDAVRFADGVRTLHEHGVTTFVEIGPGGVLSALAQGCLEDADALTVPVLRADRPEPDALTTAIGELHAHGVSPDWAAYFPGARRVPLPTYAFQRERYWIAPAPGAGDVRAAGLGAADHPLLSAAVTLAGGDERLLTGRLSLRTHPWLADHAVLGSALLPGTAFVELAVRAADEAGCGTLRDLTLEAPLVLPERGGVAVQVWVGADDGTGRRPLTVHARPDEDADLPWVRHASGFVAEAASDSVEPLPAAWPPAGAEPVSLDGFYERLHGLGLEYGPAFRGLRGVWRAGEEIHAELALPDGTDADAFVLHPALLDAALHALAAGGDGREDDPERSGEADGPLLPFAWSGVTVRATGAATVRVRLTPAGPDAYALLVADAAGEPVATVEELTLRRIAAHQLREQAGEGTADDALYGVEWVRLPAPTEEGTGSLSVIRFPDVAALMDAEQPLPESGAVVVPCPDVVPCQDGEAAPGPDGADSGTLTEAARVRAVTAEVLRLLQWWLAEDRADARLVLLVRGDDLAHAAAGGLIRSAQSEHPDRVLLLEAGPETAGDEDGPAGAGDVPDELVVAAVRTDEPRVAVRDGELYAPRLTRMAAQAPADADEGRPKTPVLQGTVLLTGASGALGRHLARHLVSEHGVRSLLLVSRRGAAADGADELTAELAAAGAEVTWAACDVADRDALAEVLRRTPVDAVVHTAGVLDDGVLHALTPDRLDTVLTPKVDALFTLDELTGDRTPLVVFSSVAGVLGNPGQANYAAANSFADAFAHRRRAAGRPTLSLAWGLWEQDGAMADALGAADRSRMARGGVLPLSTEDGLRLFDAALTGDAAVAVPVRLDTAGLRRQPASAVPAPLRGFARAVPARRAAARAAGAGTPFDRFAGLPPEERLAAVRDVVCAEAAAVLGHASARAIDPTHPFQGLGFDSLTAVELRNRLHQATGLRLSATLVFDHPTPDALARHLAAELFGADGETAPAITRQAPALEDDPIAIVGMSCRLPGGVRSPEELWDLVRSGRDGITGFPDNRGWDLDALYDPDPAHLGTSYTAHGGFLHEADRFDAGFFGISPREALAMDPQQRLLLETAWETFERAGIDPATLRGSRTGVFTGLMYHDYGQGTGELPDGVEGLLTTGGSGSVASGRLSYTFGLEGPAVTVDTACSSSLVALHLAIQAIRNGECEMALAGGVTVMASPTVFVEFSRQRGLSPDGRCKAFAAGADGTGWGEGVGLLLVERLSEARRNGHPVLAVVRGSAVNQDGASNGLTAPNGPSQQRVIRAALASAGLSASDVDAVEAHGTGTTLGDPIEAQALLATYGQERDADQPLWLGSLKSNIGHTQAAAGVAGVIKMVMALRHGVLPQTLHVDEPTPHVDWSAGAVRLLTEAVEWPATDRPRRAAVSSFGVSGTNAHTIIEQAPTDAEPVPSGTVEPVSSGTDAPVSSNADEQAPAPAEAEPADLDTVPWMLSGKSEAALRSQAARLAALLESAETGGDRRPALADLAFSLATTRAAFDHRAVVVADQPGTFRRALTALAQGTTPPEAVTGTARTSGKAVFVFPGQGSQWAGMAVEMLRTSPVFRERIEECERALAPHVDWSLTELLRQEDEIPAERVDVLQPVLWAVTVALAAVWKAYGVTPAAVIGHSQGEVAAAVVAGALSLEDGARVVARRSHAVRGLQRRGGMASVTLPEEQARDLLDRWAGRLGIGAVNGPGSVVVSGDLDALDELLAHCAEHQIQARRVAVDYAAHSPQIEQVEEDARAGFAGVTPLADAAPFYSTVTGAALATEELDAGYWYRNMRQTVRFHDAIGAALDAGHDVFIEVSPHPVQLTGVQDAIEAAGADAVVVPTLRRGDGGRRRFLLSLGQAHAHGVGVDWRPALPGARAVDLPTYAFQHERYWLDAGPVTGDVRAAGLGPADHPLLGAAVELPDAGGHLLTGLLSLQTHSWLADHAVLGTVLLPGTAFVELAAHAAAETGCALIDELTLHAPLILPERGGVALQVLVGAPDEAGRRPLSVHSRAEEGPWVRNASGALASADSVALEPVADGAWPPAGAEPVALEGFYDGLADLGLQYGPLFQGLRAVWRHEDGVYAELALPQDGADAGAYGIHPALLDAALHALGAGDLLPAADGPLLPFAWSRAAVHATGAGTLRVRLAPAEDGAVSLTATDDAGRPVVSVESLTLRAVAADQLRGRARDSLFTVEWSALTAPATPATATARDWSVRLCTDIPELLADPAGAVSPEADADPEAYALAVLLPGADTAPDEPEARRVHHVLAEVLDLLRWWLAEERPGRLVLVTRGAVATGAGADDASVPDPVQAAVWGLARSAQSENPDRVVLLDADPRAGTETDALLQTLPALLTQLTDADEPQAAVRGDALLVPRLARPTQGAEAQAAVDFGDGAVLLTGASGALGALVARHLVTEHKVSRLLLVSRRGAEADGAAELEAELTAAGAEVTWAACDVADRDALAEVLASAPPVSAIVHTAGVLDDGLVASLTPERLATVLRPKVDAVRNLEELAGGSDLTAFVLFSSLAGTLGTPGQANYAAANAYLDAFAQRRRAEGRPVTSLAWGLWQRTGTMTGEMGDSDRTRLARGGVTPLSDTEGLELLDAALASGHALAVPARLDLPALRNAGTPVPTLLRTLVGTGTRRPAPSGSSAAVPLTQRLAGLTEDERAEAVLDLVRGEVAAVLGHGSATAVQPDRAFQELGFDSLTAVELRNRLNQATGLRLPATLVFDHPTPTALAQRVLKDLPGDPGQASVFDEIDRLADALATAEADAGTDNVTRTRITMRLQVLLARWTGEQPTDRDDHSGAEDDDLSSTSDDELFELLDEELGGS
ncbi:type I polyketide synthase [Streptomyces sp. NPDC003077]|uniref:type I polyketide synthase n=1 Tax=Streptomyces sp. NPDC003077 TaxID=3154443 RepID=UPI0033BE154F